MSRCCSPRAVRPVAKRIKRPVFYANRKIIDRFRLKEVPSIIRQKGQLMEVTEIALPVGYSRLADAARKKQDKGINP